MLSTETWSAQRAHATTSIFTRTFGPLIALRAYLADQPDRAAAFDRDFLEFASSNDRGARGGPAEYHYEYQLVVARTREGWVSRGRASGSSVEGFHAPVRETGEGDPRSRVAAVTIGPESEVSGVSDSRRRVVVAGAGVAGLETALALRAYAEDLVSVEVVAPEREFTYRPLAVAEPFLADEVRRVPLEGLVRAAGADFRSGTLAAVDTEHKVALLGTGSAVAYDVLVLAVGARTCEAVPGALTFRGPESGADIVALLADATAGNLERIVFALPAAATWPLPLYELALLTTSYLDQRGAKDVEVVLVTPEARPLAVFGPAASAATAKLLELGGVQVESAAVAQAWEAGMLHLVGGATIPADRVVALPRLEGPPIVGLPQDESGFVATDELGRVSGMSDVYAAGDLTRSWIKQGGIAAQQADAVASAIAGDVGAEIQPTPFSPVLRGLLLTGSAPRFLRSEKGTSIVNPHPLWWPPSKIVGRHLTPFLAEHLGMATGVDEPPPVEGVPVEVALETRDRTTWSSI